MANRVLLGNVRGEAGAVGPAGATGQAGVNGLTPYVKNGTWWLGTEDTGITAKGNEWLFGNGQPTTQGNNGDMYLDTSRSDVYKKINNVWRLIDNIQGPQGEQGIQGPQGEASLNVEVVETITGEVGTPAKVENLGDNQDVRLKFTIPKGEDGTTIKVGEEIVRELTFKSDPQTQIESRVAEYQGNENIGKYLVVDESGYVVASTSTPSENIIEAYIVGEKYSASWLSATESGVALTPTTGKIYIVRTQGNYYLLQYIWNGERYIRTNEEKLQILNQSINIESEDWIALENATPYKWQVTKGVEFTGLNLSVIELINNKPVLFAKYGFAISDVEAIVGGASGRFTIRIIAIDLPSEALTLTIGGQGYYDN